MGYGLQVTGYGLQVTGYGSRVISYGLRVEGYGLWVMGSEMYCGCGCQVTSIGTGDSSGAINEKEMAVLGAVLKEKGKAEEALKASGLAWTIVRPGGLLSDVRKPRNPKSTRDPKSAPGIGQM